MTITRKLILAALLSASPALAQTGGTQPATTATQQVAPDAARLLDQAKAQLGAAALDTLKTYQDSSILTVYGPNGQAAGELIVKSYLDVPGKRVRVETYVGNDLLQIQQATPAGAYSWTKQSGTLKLPANLARELSGTLNQGLLGLRLGGQGREKASVLGEQTFGGVKGVAVRVTTDGTSTTYLLSPEGRLLGERLETVQSGEVTTVYGKQKVFEGLSVPVEGKLYLGGQLFAQAATQDAKINQPLSDDTFKLPAP